MAQVLSTLASLTLVVVVFLYLRQVVRGSSVPNPATWLIWVVVSTMNTITYFSVVHGNVFEWTITLVATLGLTAIFLYSLIRGKFGRIGEEEILCTALAFGIGIFWRTTGDAIMANIFLQAIFLISFLPTMIGLVRGTLREKPLPWTLATIAYSLLILAILADWEDGSGYKLIHPIVNGLIGNGGAALTIWWTNRKS